MMRNISNSPGLLHNDRPSSKSSKSSSLTTSNTDAGLNDLSHFEDIGLDDDHATYKKNKALTSGGSIAAGTGASSLRVTSLTGNGRALTNGTQTSITQLADSVHSLGSTASLSLTLPNGPRRAKTSPNLGIITNGRRDKSRSPSPTHLNQRPVSPHNLQRIPSNGGLRGISGSHSKHKTLGPRPRKSAKEIEADYHDSDDDLPEDASLWNVPLSPSLYRTASSAVNSANVSASTSPERPSYLTTSPNLGHLRSSKTSPLPAKPFPQRADSFFPSPTSPRMSQARASTGSLDTFTMHKARAKSWSNILSDLSEDVMALSEALDAHDIETGDGRDPITGAAITAKRRIKSSIIELPPLRRNNVMIDPLPVSKEKEKVLSRTRPSWLPPKSQKEEQRHLREYRRMMEASLEAEKKRLSKLATAKCARDDTVATLQKIWDEHVLPNWGQAIREPRTRELLWRGVPQKTRPEVWKRAITNELGLTSNTYTKALARAHSMEIKKPSSDDSLHSEITRETHWLRAIRRDVRHTLPALHLFQAGQPLHEQLIDLLSAYAMYRSDIGYVYGTHLPAALLLLTLPSLNEAFVTLANYLNRPLPLAFLVEDHVGISRTYDLILNLLHAKRPRLYERLFGPANEGNLSLTPEEVFEPMIRTMFLNGCCDADDLTVPPTPMTAAAVKSTFPSFSFTLPTPRSPRRPISPRTPNTPGFSFRGVATSSSKGLSLPLVQRLWDVIVFDGDAAIIRICVGILAAKESSLYGSRESVMEILGWNGAFRLGEDAGGFGGLTGSTGDRSSDHDIQQEEEEAVEQIMTLIRGIGKEERHQSNAKRYSGSALEDSTATVMNTLELKAST